MMTFLGALRANSTEERGYRQVKMSAMEYDKEKADAQVSL